MHNVAFFMTLSVSLNLTLHLCSFSNLTEFWIKYYKGPSRNIKINVYENDVTILNINQIKTTWQSHFLIVANKYGCSEISAAMTTSFLLNMKIIHEEKGLTQSWVMTELINVNFSSLCQKLCLHSMRIVYQWNLLTYTQQAAATHTHTPFSCEAIAVWKCSAHVHIFICMQCISTHAWKTSNLLTTLQTL